MSACVAETYAILRIVLCKTRKLQNTITRIVSHKPIWEKKIFAKTQEKTLFCEKKVAKCKIVWYTIKACENKLELGKMRFAAYLGRSPYYKKSAEFFAESRKFRSKPLEGTTVLNFLLVDSWVTLTVFIAKLVLAVILLACVAFIITIVLKQKGNSDGMEAMMGGSKSDDSETYYGKNAASRKERKLKIWTYVCSGVMAVCCIAFLLLGLIK